MTRCCAAILVFCFATLLGVGQDEKREQNPPSEYAVLLARVQNGDTSIDFQKLRFSYMESPERKSAKDTSDQEAAMFKALNVNDFKEAIKNADTVLANEFVNLDAHYVESVAYGKLQDSGKADFHRAVFAGLFKSIIGSGDGKSPATAYVVISTHEEYVVLNVMGLTPGTQSLIHDGGHSYDRMEVKDRKTNETVTLYFNVDIPFKHYLN
ncbi:MAG TPA: DUF4919 domain-containing protein [Verrucomicrobiae bacterium]|jgi:hypothetical protein|nr:DUF4919 domain-containing protein [Verrucomicrobiae bacterium]